MDKSFKSIIRFLKTNRKIKSFLDRRKFFHNDTGLINFESALGLITEIILEVYRNTTTSFSQIENFIWTSKMSEEYKDSIVDVAILNFNKNRNNYPPKTIRYIISGISANNMYFITKSGFEIPIDRVVKLNGKKFDLKEYCKKLESEKNVRRIRDEVLTMTVKDIIEYFNERKNFSR